MEKLQELLQSGDATKNEEEREQFLSSLGHLITDLRQTEATEYLGSNVSLTTNSVLDLIAACQASTDFSAEQQQVTFRGRAHCECVKSGRWRWALAVGHSGAGLAVGPSQLASDRPPLVVRRWRFADGGGWSNACVVRLARRGRRQRTVFRFPVQQLPKYFGVGGTYQQVTCHIRLALTKTSILCPMGSGLQIDETFCQQCRRDSCKISGMHSLAHERCRYQRTGRSRRSPPFSDPLGS